MKAINFISFVVAIWTLPSIRGQSSTELPTGPGVRCGVFLEFPGQHWIGAEQVPSITSQEACWQYCVDNNFCTAVEFDTERLPSNCWIYQVPVNTGDLYDDPTLTLRVLTAREACTSPGSTVTTVSPSGSTSSPSPSSTALPTGGTCGSFRNFDGQHALGAQPQSGITDQQICLDNCLANRDCTAYEFDTNPGVQVRCWFHLAPVDPTTDLYNDDPLISIFILDRFPCTSTVSGPSSSSASGVSSQSTTSATIVTTGNATGTGECFQVLNNTNALGAQQMAEPKTEEECRTTCLGMRSCTAFETDLIDPNNFKCWIHTTDLGELFNTDKVAIHIRVSCLLSTTARFTTTTGTGGVGQCVVFGPPLIDTQSIGAIGHGSISDQACADLCRFDTTCVAYEIDSVLPDRCWTHHDPNNLNVVYDTNFVNQFRVLSRECTTSGTTGTTGSATTTPTIPSVCANYRTLPNTQSILATPQTGITSADACRNVCTTNARCVAYELDTDPTSTYCWIHTDPQTLLTLYDSNTVTQFQVTDRNCGSTGSSVSMTTGTGSSSTGTSSSSGTSGSSGSSGSSSGSTNSSGNCQFTWTQVDNQNVPGGTPNRATDLPSCQLACTNNVYCIGIDINNNNGQFFCFIITVDLPLTSFPGNTHYTLARSPGCPTGPPTQPQSTVAPSTTPFDPTQGCANFRVIVGYNADGGNLLGTMSRQECLIACVRDPTCFAVDYVEAQRLCFGHTSLSGAQLATCCTRYECASSPCTDAFDRYPNQSPSLSLGEVQTAATTASQCQTACISKNCTRYSYVVAPRIPTQACYLYYAGGNTTGREQVSNQQGIDLYVRKRCIPSPEVPPTTTMASPGSLPPNYCPVDLVFIIDSSGSIRDNQPPNVDNWALIKAFMIDIVQTYLNVGVQTDRLAVVSFSDAAVLNFDFNRYTDPNQLITAIQNLPFIGYETNTPAALDVATRLLSDLSSGARNRSSKVTCLITDGVVSPQWESQYQPAIDRLKAFIKQRFSIGVTTQISVSQLLQFTENADAYRTIQGFPDLPSVRSDLGTFISSVDCDGNSILTSPLTTTGSTTTVAGNGGSSNSSESSGNSSSSASSNSTSTSLTTTSAPPTTTVDPFLRGEGCFGAITRNSTTGIASPLTFPTLVANKNNVYITQTDSFVATAVSGFYFITICAGAIQSTAAQVITIGAYPPMGYVWLSTAHTGAVSNCRSGILSMTRGVRVYLRQASGGVFSNNDVQTSWSMFSVTDVIKDQLSVLSAIHRQPVSAPQVIPFINPIANPPGQYDPSRYQYLCGSSGVFFFSFSAGVAGGQTAAVRLIGLANQYEISSATKIQNSVVTIDRVVVAQCDSSRVSVQVTTGQITPGGSTQSLISFQAFPYALPTGGTSASWGLYRTSSLSAATDPVPFDSAQVTQGVTYNNNMVTVTTGGYYYVYVSVGCPAGQRVFVTMRIDSQTLFSVLREATNDDGVQTLGHGVVVLLQPGSVLKVVNEPNSALFSSQDGLHTSFVGIRLYDP